MITMRTKTGGKRIAALLLATLMMFSVLGMARPTALADDFNVSVVPMLATGVAADGCSATASGTFSAGETITLTANTGPGFIFESWSAQQGLINNNISGLTSPTATFTMPGSDVLIHAIFRAAGNNAVTVTASPAAGGTASSPSATAFENAQVSLSAEPSPGYRFVNWTGNVSFANANAQSTTFTMPNGAANATANFAPNNVTVTVTPANSGTVTTVPPTPALTAVPAGTMVALRAVANTGFAFDRWVDPPSGATPPTETNISFLMPAGDVNITASFSASGFTVTVNPASPATGGSASANPTLAASGAQVTVTAVPASGQGFSRWDSTGTAITGFDATHRNNNPATFTMPNGNVTLTPVFGTARSVTVNRNNNSWGTAQVTNSTAVAAGGRVNLSATPASGYTFLRWETEPLNAFSFANPQSANTASFIMPSGTGAVTVRAIFEVTGIMNLTSNNTTWGSATYSPTNPSRGSTVSLSASPASGYALSFWRLITPTNLVLTNNFTQNATFTMPSSGNVSIEAVFAAGYQLTVTSNNTSMGTARPTNNSGAATYGSTVNITATAASGHRFVRWETSSSSLSALNDSTSNPASFAMPNSSVNIRAIFEPTGQAVTLNVNNVSGASAILSATNINAVTATPSTSASITVPQNVTVHMSANPPSGFALANWEIIGTPPSGFSNSSINNRFSAAASFTMPSGAVSVRANFAEGRQVTVTTNDSALGTAAPNSGAARNNTTVTLTASPTSGNRFVRWEVVSGSVTISNPNSTTATFTMPNTAVSVRAVFESGQAITAGGGVSISYTQSGSVFTLTMPTDKVNEIISKATGSTVVIDMTRVSALTTATMPRAALTQFTNSGFNLELRMPHGTMALSRAAVQSAATQSTGTQVSVSLSTVAQTTLTTAERQAIKVSDIVYRATIMSGTQAITNFDGAITMTLSYSGQLPVAVWRLSGSTLERLTSTHNATARTVTFSTNHLSLFVVGWDGTTEGSDNPFRDVRSSDWFFTDVMFAFNNSLMGSTSTAQMVFSPAATLSRAMLVTILYRFDGEPSVANLTNPFRDVPANQWYTDAVIWAASNKIVSGYAEGRFGPNNNITRQDFAVILVNYAGYARVTLPSVNTYNGFNDDSRIGAYARPAVIRCFQAGIIGGKPGNLFDPLGNSTRAEAAAMLHRFINAVR